MNAGGVARRPPLLGNLLADINDHIIGSSGHL